MTGCINMYPVIFIFMVENYSADYKCDIFDVKSEVIYNKTTVMTDLRTIKDNDINKKENLVGVDTTDSPFIFH